MRWLFLPGVAALLIAGNALLLHVGLPPRGYAWLAWLDAFFVVTAWHHWNTRYAVGPDAARRAERALGALGLLLALATWALGAIYIETGRCERPDGTPTTPRGACWNGSSISCRRRQAARGSRPCWRWSAPGSHGRGYGA